VLAPEPLTGVRVVAEPAAIDALVIAAGSTLVRIAPDDAFVIGAAELSVSDPHAIVERETTFAGVWVDRSLVSDWLARTAEWHLPHEDGLSQGMAAALPIKVLTTGGRALVMVPVSFAHELADRLGDPR